MQSHFGGQMQRYLVTEQIHRYGCHVCDQKRGEEEVQANGITQLVVKSLPRQQKFIFSCFKVIKIKVFLVLLNVLWCALPSIPYLTLPAALSDICSLNHSVAIRSYLACPNKRFTTVTMICID